MTARSHFLLFAAPFLMASLMACAAPQVQKLAIPYEPIGPGHVFGTVEEAVIDALAYSHEEARRTQTMDRLRGGVVSRTDRGFTYDRIRVADPERPTHIEYPLVTGDVARFHAYPRTNRPRDDYRNERPSRQDRRSVDRIDPLHRPVFVLTPKLLVKAYYGPEQPVHTVANLRQLDMSDRYLAQAPR
jgi:hypothetical protein